MNNLNTLPIENFLEKARIARKSGQKTLNLPINEVEQLENSLAIVMTRLCGEMDTILLNIQQSSDITISMDGGSL